MGTKKLWMSFCALLQRVFKLSAREVGLMIHNPMYIFCMLIFPLVIIFFFTSLLNEGVPKKLPCGVIDNDHTSTSRSIIQQLDAFQTTRIAGYYNNVNEAREAIQRNDIYAFLYIPKGTTENLLAQREPKLSFYYSNVVLMAGGILFKDLKTVTTLISAKVGSAKLQMLGQTPKEIRTFIQPIALDVHMIGNPWMNYNIYLTSVMVPGILIIFMMLITTYSLGTELKFKRAHKWMKEADNNIIIALLGKLLPQLLLFLTIFLGYEWYIYGILNFPHPGGLRMIVSLAILTVLSSQSFGVFIFGLMPSLRMSMSICSLWSVAGFSACGATFPLFAMDGMIQALAQTIPLRHYYMIYQICLFNGFPIIDAWENFLVLIIFILLPILVLWNIKRAMKEYVYIP